MLRYPSLATDNSWIRVERVQAINSFGHFTVRLNESEKGCGIDGMLQRGQTHLLQAVYERDGTWKNLRYVFLVDLRMAMLKQHLSRSRENGQDGTYFLTFRIDDLRKAKELTFWEQLYCKAS